MANSALTGIPKGLAALARKRQAIKDRYPKPEKK